MKPPNAPCRNAIRGTSSRAMSLDARRTGPIAAVGLDMVPRAHRVQKNTPVHVKNPPCRASGSEAGRRDTRVILSGHIAHLRFSKWAYSPLTIFTTRAYSLALMGGITSSPAMMLKTRVDAFKPRRKSHSVIGVLKRTPRTKPPPVWVPLPPAWVIISPRRREARDGRRRETRETWTAEEKKNLPPRELEPRRTSSSVSRASSPTSTRLFVVAKKIASTYAVFSAQ